MPTRRQAAAIDVEGTGIVSTALIELVNRFPGLQGKKITFSTLSDASGIGLFPTSGAVLLSYTEDITGHVRQMCLYPFNVVYRSAPKTDRQKLRIKEFLDALGKWLEREPVTISGSVCQLSEYPALEQGRTIKRISRTTPAHLDSAYQDGIEDWLISVTLRYEAEYDK